jgi:hypothetical protein
MAELALYQNRGAPIFPFHDVAKHLQELQAFSDQIIDPDEYGRVDHWTVRVLIDTILVFGRARTAAYHPVTVGTRNLYSLASTLTSYFNALLLKSNATEHQIELVLRGNRMFYITCKYSPRFNWASNLTQREIGMNLDFIAAGHVPEIGQRWYPVRGSCSIIERGTLVQVYAEEVILELIKPEEEWNKFVNFNKAKESLYNETMLSLHLPYRFKWLFQDDQKLSEVDKIMACDTPPSSDWWEDNCMFVAGYGDKLCWGDTTFCTFDSRYSEFWPLVQHAYLFQKRYRTKRFLDLWRLTSVGRKFWQSMSKVFWKIRCVIAQPMNSTTATVVVHKFKKALEQLAREGDNVPICLLDSSTPPTSEVGDVQPQRGSTWNLRRLSETSIWNLRRAREVMGMHMFETYKLKPGLVFEGLPLPEKGKEFLLECMDPPYERKYGRL